MDHRQGGAAPAAPPPGEQATVPHAVPSATTAPTRVRAPEHAFEAALVFVHAVTAQGAGALAAAQFGARVARMVSQRTAVAPDGALALRRSDPALAACARAAGLDPAHIPADLRVQIAPGRVRMRDGARTWRTVWPYPAHRRGRP